MRILNNDRQKYNNNLETLLSWEEIVSIYFLANFDFCFLCDDEVWLWFRECVQFTTVRWKWEKIIMKKNWVYNTSVCTINYLKGLDQVLIFPTEWSGDPIWSKKSQKLSLRDNFFFNILDHNESVRKSRFFELGSQTKAKL